MLTRPVLCAGFTYRIDETYASQIHVIFAKFFQDVRIVYGLRLDVLVAWTGGSDDYRQQSLRQLTT